MYRIKIDELVNGENRYTPQVGKLHIYGGWTKRQEIRWTNINDSYLNESDAMMVIESYKHTEEIKKGREVASSTFKIIE
jgi:hypothetical protein